MPKHLTVTESEYMANILNQCHEIKSRKRLALTRFTQNNFPTVTDVEISGCAGSRAHEKNPKSVQLHTPFRNMKRFVMRVKPEKFIQIEFKSS